MDIYISNPLSKNKNENDLHHCNCIHHTKTKILLENATPLHLTTMHRFPPLQQTTTPLPPPLKTFPPLPPPLKTSLPQYQTRLHIIF